MGLAEKVRQLRSERGWTQAELAKRAGLTRGYIANLEGSKVVHRPSAVAMLKLARAFNVKPEELYHAAGYIRGTESTILRVETLEEILDRLRIAAPQSIPVYAWHYFPFQAGEGIDPTEYVYRARDNLAKKSIEAYIVHGNYLNPHISDGDVIVVDRGGVIDHGDIVACVVNNEVNLCRVHKVADQVWLENNHGKFKYVDSQHASRVIELIRRMK